MTVATRQNEDRSIRMLAAQRQLYREAKIARRVRVGGSVGLAGAAPLLALLWPNSGTVLGSLGGAWLLLSRSLLRPLEQGRVDRAADVQEEFDTYVLNLPWDPAKSTHPDSQLVAAAARRHLAQRTAERTKALADWYGDAPTVAPFDALACQQANLSWSSRLQREWANVVVLLVAALALLGVVVAVAADLTVSTYLVAVLLPSLPAFVEGLDSREANLRQARALATASDEARTAWSAAIADPSTVPLSRCRSIQDQVWQLRRQRASVPDWYYALRRGRFETDMRSVVSALSDDAARHKLA